MRGVEGPVRPGPHPAAFDPVDDPVHRQLLQHQLHASTAQSGLGLERRNGRRLIRPVRDQRARLERFPRVDASRQPPLQRQPRDGRSRLKEESEAYKARIVAQAQGDAQRFRSVLAEYQKAPQVTRDRMYIDTMQQVYSNVTKVMVESRQGSNLLYLPLDKIMQMTAGQAGASAPADTALSSSVVPVPTTPAVPAPTTSTLDSRSRDALRTRDRDTR